MKDREFERIGRDRRTADSHAGPERLRPGSRPGERRQPAASEKELRGGALRGGEESGVGPWGALCTKPASCRFILGVAANHGRDF